MTAPAGAAGLLLEAVGLPRRPWRWWVRRFRCWWMRRACDLAVALHPDDVRVVMHPRHRCPCCGRPQW